MASNISPEQRLAVIAARKEYPDRSAIYISGITGVSEPKVRQVVDSPDVQLGFPKRSRVYSSKAAKGTDLNHRTVNGIAQRPDIRNRNGWLLPAERESLVKRMEQTGNAAKAAREFGVSKQTAQRHARAANIPLKLGPDTVSKRHEEIIAARQAGVSPTELARRHGISREHVYQVLRDAGVIPAHPEVAERARANMQHMNSDPLSPLKVGRLRGALERALNEGNQELFHRKLNATSRDMKIAILNENRKFTMPSVDSTQHAGSKRGR
jgi:hypothetical protein